MADKNNEQLLVVHLQIGFFHVVNYIVIRTCALRSLRVNLLAFVTGNLSIFMEPSVSGVGVRPGYEP